MSSRQQKINAPAAVVYRLLTDIGGWRIWNRRVAFSEIDGDAVVGGRGVLYLRSLAWLPWSLRIEEMQHNQKFDVCANCLSVHVHIRFEVQTGAAGQVVLCGVLHSDGLFGRLASSKILPLWHGFLAAALSGIRYAAESVSAAATASAQP